jgi:phosphatidylserine/phosphatidylglycerophosphate/cardiolipin synthase-like enzyme
VPPAGATSGEPRPQPEPGPGPAVPDAKAGATDARAAASPEPSRSATDPNATAPAIRLVAPNPVADGDRGEFLVVTTPVRAVLTDGEGRYPVPAGTTALSPDPAAARNRTDRPVRHADGLALSNAGERLRLVVARNRSTGTANGTGTGTANATSSANRTPPRTLATATYRDAPEGERYRPGEGWRPPGYQPREVRTFGPADATTFVLPDAPGPPIETLRSADDRLLLAGYTLASERVVAALVAAHRRGVQVRVLVEGSPVGGASARQARLLDRLVAAGVEVRALGGPRGRYAFHHPKYAVVDNRAVVTTENWKPAGTGGRSSRGWGVVVDSAAVAADLAAVFAHDADWRAATPWRVHRRNQSFTADPAANGSYPTRFDPARVRVDRVDVVTAPGNAEAAIVDLVDGARDRVVVEQPGVGGVDQPFVRACLRAARRGVDVRILLSSAWYTAAENRATVDRLNAVADREGLPLEARVSEPAGRYDKIHAKGLVVDDVAVVGSVNWNNDSVRDNREVAVALHGSAAADYYVRVFEADWRGRRPIPIVVVLVALAAVGVAIAVAWRRVSFRPRDGRSGGGRGGGGRRARNGTARGSAGCGGRDGPSTAPAAGAGRSDRGRPGPGPEGRERGRGVDRDGGRRRESRFEDW